MRFFYISNAMERKKESEKSSYFDFLEIIHKENTLSIFDNERLSEGEGNENRVNESFFFLSRLFEEH